MPVRQARRHGSDAIRRSRELFSSLIPAQLWPRLKAAKRVFVSAHRGLHRLPFELLVTDIKDGKPVYWLDEGPAVAYVPSGSVLHWLRKPGIGVPAVCLPSMRFYLCCYN